MKKNLLPFLVFILSLSACSSNQGDKVNNKDISSLPAWYIAPKQNDASSLYGVGEGYTLEEATKSALADAAARLIVSVSSTSSLLREENNYSANEEMRQKIQQNIEKIDFVNFYVTQSTLFESRIYAEIAMDRDPFIRAQKEKSEYLERKIANLQKNISAQNLIQKRNSLLEIVELLKQSELLARITQAVGENSNVKKKLAMLSDAQNQLAKLNDKIEFYFEISSDKNISSIIRSALNKEAVAVAKIKTGGANQVVVAIRSSQKTDEIYGAYITKLRIDFENKSGAKVIASNSIEVSGSSTISRKESRLSALESLKEKIEKEGVLKILGII